MRYWKQLKNFIIEHRYMVNSFVSHYRKEIKNILIPPNSIPINDYNIWISKYIKMSYAYPEFRSSGIDFFSADVRLLKDITINSNDVILICVEKNELVKVKKQICYHKKLGITKFAFLDNNSNDGTFEWLMKQDDVAVFTCDEPYSTEKREVWINRIVSYFGLNRWYIVVDSDEFLVYRDCERKNIYELIDNLQNKRIYRARAIMIDMYAESEYYRSGNTEDFMEKCRFFDYNTYEEKKCSRYEAVYGGPRMRLFGEAPLLTKYPLSYWGYHDIECNSHFLYPHIKNFGNGCILALKHYKFLPGEVEKYREIAKNGTYYNDSSQYKRYIEVINNTDILDFFFEKTYEYVDSSSFDKISVYSGIDWI